MNGSSTIVAQLPNGLHLPTHRHLPNRRLLRRLAAGAVGEQVRHQRGLALPLQADLALPGLPGGLDGAQDVGDGALFGERRKRDNDAFYVAAL